MSELRTDFKDDVLDVTQNEKRKYRVIHNDDGTISLEDATVYLQKGDSFGANDINEMNEITNQMLGVNEKLEEINRHPKTSLTSEEGTHDLRYSEKQLQVKENDNWIPATVDMFYGDGKKINKILYAQKMGKESSTNEKLVSPESVNYQRVAEYDGIVHMFSTTKQYTFDGKEINLLRTLPFEISTSSAIIEYQGYLHIFSQTNHHRYDGEYWTTLEPLPQNTYSRVVLHKDELHFIFGTTHYKYDGNTWTTLNAMLRPNTSNDHGVAFVYNDILYSICYTTLYKYIDESDSWEIVKTYNGEYLAVNSRINPYTIIGNKLYIGWHAVYTNSSYTAQHNSVTVINLDDFSYEQICSLSIDSTGNLSNASFVNINDTLYSVSTAGVYEFKVGTWWYVGALMPVQSSYFELVKFKDEYHLLGITKLRPWSTTGYHSYQQHIKRVNGEWVEDIPCPVNVQFPYTKVVTSSKGIHVIGNSISGEKSATYDGIHYVFDGEVWTRETSLPHTTQYCVGVAEHKGEACIYFYGMNSVIRKVCLYRGGEWVTVYESTSNLPPVSSHNGKSSMLMCSFKGLIYFFYDQSIYTLNTETGKASQLSSSSGYKVWKTHYFNSVDEELFIFGGASSSADNTSYMTGVLRYVKGVLTSQTTCESPKDTYATLLIENEEFRLIKRDGVDTENFKLSLDIDTIIRAE